MLEFNKYQYEPALNLIYKVEKEDICWAQEIQFVLLGLQRLQGRISGGCIYGCHSLTGV